MKEKQKVDHSSVSGCAMPVAESTNASAIEILKGVLTPVGGPIDLAPHNSADPFTRVNPLSRIERGKKPAAPRILIYGTEGVGKSTVASKAPKPIFIQTEDGLGQIDCAKFPLAKTFKEVMEYLEAIASAKHEYETIVIDSLDWLERIVWSEVCRRTNASNIEKVMGGFAKGYTAALDEWRQVIDVLDKCRSRGMVVILIAHSRIEKVEDPETSNYDRHSPRLHKHAQALLVEWVDAALFATKKMIVRKEGTGFDERGIASPVGADGGERILKCIGGPNVLAKNRYDLPSEIPLSWDALVGEISKSM